MAYLILNFIRPQQHSNKGTVGMRLSVYKKFYSDLVQVAFWAQSHQGKNTSMDAVVT